MECSLEQQYAIEFCVQREKNATKIFRSKFGRWHKAFKEGQEEIADEPRSGRTTTARTDHNVNSLCFAFRPSIEHLVNRCKHIHICDTRDDDRESANAQGLREVVSPGDQK